MISTLNQKFASSLADSYQYVRGQIEVNILLRQNVLEAFNDRQSSRRRQCLHRSKQTQGLEMSGCSS